MQLKHITAIVSLLAALVFPAFAQEAVDASAALQTKLQALTSFRARFEQTVTDVQGQILQQASGTLTIAQPELLYWQVLQPDETVLIADGETLWHVDPFVEQVTALSQSDAIANNPIVLLTSPDNSVWQGYSVENNGSEYAIKANDPEGQIETLRIVFDGQSLSSLEFIDRQQQVSQFAFSQQEINISIDNTLFEFTLPDGYTLDDQRTE